MGGREELPRDLVEGRSRFRAWRSGRRLGERIPATLWAVAVRLARRHGLSRTATALSVDYYSLKERSAAAVGDRALQATAFVELPAPVLGGKHCRFELDDGAGATLRVHLQGYDTADLEILARRFGKAE